MSTIEIHMKPQGEVLAAYMESRARVTCIMGPLGSGKTFQSCQKILTLMCEQRPNRAGVRKSRWYAIRNTYPDLTSTTIKDWLELFGDLGKYKGGGMEPPTHSLDFDLEDGTTVQSQLVFVALDREDAVKKLRGAQVTGFWLNEMKELPKSIVDMADLRHGRYPSAVDGGASWHGMIGDTNAPDEDHWYYRLAEEERPQGWEFYKQPGGVFNCGEDGNGRIKWQPNPLAENINNLPDGYYQRGLAGKSDDWIKVNLANEYGFVQDGKPVHPHYIDSVHCAGTELAADPDYPICIGIDFGRTPAAVIWQKNAVGRWTALDEFVTEDMSAALFGPELKRYLDQHYPGYQVEAWGDPAGSGKGQATDDTPIQILRAHGIPVQPCHSNDPTLRRAAIANPCTRLCMDGKPGLLISPKCRVLRKGLMGGFCYKRLKVAGDERYHELPDKNKYSHVVEAAEYALLGGGEGHAAVRPKTPVVKIKSYRPRVY